MIGPSRMPSLLSFLFNLAWASRIRLPLLIAAAFMVTNIHMRLEININFEMEEQIVVQEEPSDDDDDDDSSISDSDDDDEHDEYYDNEIYYCSDDELLFLDEDEDDDENNGRKENIHRSSTGDSSMQNKNENESNSIINHQNAVDQLQEHSDDCTISHASEIRR